jgi:hypothetical protein
MTNQDARVDLLQRRLSLVANLSALNAEAFRLTQALAGVEMDIQRFELEITKNGATGKLVRDLHGVEMSAESIRLTRTKCGENIASVESDLAEVDRLLAGAKTAGERL